MLTLALVFAAGCDRADPSATDDLGIDWVEGRDFLWRDTRHPKGDFERDLKDCHGRLSADDWFLEQPPLNRSILLIGCINKHGWTWREAKQDGAPISDRRPGVATRRPA